MHTLSLREEEKEVGKDKGVHIKSILAWIEKENKEQVDSFFKKGPERQILLQVVRNLGKFGPMSNETVVIIIQVIERTEIDRLL